MVRNVTYHVHKDFNQLAYESCYDVQNPATSGSVMNLLCGPWGAQQCTAERLV